MNWKKWKLENKWSSFNKWWIVTVLLSFVYLVFFGAFEWSFMNVLKLLGALIVTWFFILGIYLGLVSLAKEFISENYAGRITMISIAFLWFIANYNEMKIDFGW